LRAKKKSGREGKRIRSEIVKFKIKICGIPRLKIYINYIKKEKEKELDLNESELHQGFWELTR